MKTTIEFYPRVLLLGVAWARPRKRLHIYIHVLPMICVHIVRGK